MKMIEERIDELIKAYKMYIKWNEYAIGKEKEAINELKEELKTYE